MGFAVGFDVGVFPQGVLVFLFFVRVFADVVGFDEESQGCGVDAPFGGEVVDDLPGALINALVEDVDEVPVDEVGRVVLIVVPDAFQNFCPRRVGLAEPGDFVVDFLDDFLVLACGVDEEGRLVGTGGFHEAQDVVFVNLIRVAAAQFVIDGQVDVGVIAARVFAEFFFDVVELAAVGLDGRGVDEVVLRQLLYLIGRIDLNVRIGVVEITIGFEETEFFSFAHGIDSVRRRCGLAQVADGLLETLLCDVPGRRLDVAAAAAGIEAHGVVNGLLEVRRYLENDDLAEAFLVVVEAVSPGKGLNDAVRAHGLAVDEERRQTRRVEAREQAVDDDDQVELGFTDLINLFLAGQSVVDVAVVGAELFHRVLCTEHGIIVLHGFLHLVLIERVLFAVFRDGIGNGDFRKIRELTLDIVVDSDGRYLPRFDVFEELVIALGLLDGARRQDGRIRIAAALVEAQFAGALVDDEIDDLQHMLVVFVGRVENLFMLENRFQLIIIGGVLPLHAVVGGELLHVEGIVVFDLKAQDGAVVQGFFDGVLVEALTVLFFRRRRQVTRTVLGVFTENGRAREAVPQGSGKILVDQVLRQGRHGTVAFIDDENGLQGVQLFVFLRAFRIAAHDVLQLLDSRDEDVAFVGLELFDQITGVVRFTDVNRVIGSISLEGTRRLVVQIAAVDDEDDFADTRQLGQVMGHLVGRQGLAGTRRMPDVARMTAAVRVGIDGVADGFDGVDLVRPQHNQRLPFTVEDGVLGDHAVRRRDRQDGLGKGEVFRHGLVMLIEPGGEELLVEVAFGGRGDVARVGSVGDDEHLKCRVNVAEGPFFEVLLNLVEGFPVRMAAVLELDLNHGHAVDQEGHVAAAVAVHRFAAGKIDLVHNFEDRRAAGNIGALEDDGIDRAQGSIFTLDADADDAVLPHEPLGGVVKGRKTQLVLDLLEFVIRQGVVSKNLFIVLHQNMAEILPQVRKSVQIIAESPLGLSLNELLNQFIFNAGFRFKDRHRHHFL